jgi:hypothetical protein
VSWPEKNWTGAVKLKYLTIHKYKIDKKLMVLYDRLNYSKNCELAAWDYLDEQ